MAQYVLDTSVFITAHLTTYPLDVVPSFWQKLKQLADDGTIISLDKVRGEILEKDDPLTDWITANLGKSIFKGVNEDTVVGHYGKVASWAESKSDQYTRKAINDFLRFEKADAWLVAYCMTYSGTVVTAEVSKPQSKAKIHLPDACIAFGVGYMNVIELFRRLGARF